MDEKVAVILPHPSSKRQFETVHMTCSERNVISNDQIVQHNVVQTG